MSQIKCIYCDKRYDDEKDTVLVREKQHEEDTQIRRLECKKCGNHHMFSVREN